MKRKYEGIGVWAGRCTGTKEVEPCIGYEKCSRFKGDYMTNADRIRAMTDEELAESMEELCIERICDIVCGDRCRAIKTLEKTARQACKDIIRDWLQQPCGGADHE